MTAAGLVNMAGGFKRSAYREQADLSSYVVQNGEGVPAAHRVIEIGKALGGDGNADATLKPGDLVGIRQLTGWGDIGASVTVSGEVVYPDSYGINEGEHLKFRPAARGRTARDCLPGGRGPRSVDKFAKWRRRRASNLIRRVESANPPAANGGMQAAQEQAAALQTMEQQRQQILASLRGHPASGCLT